MEEITSSTTEELHQEEEEEEVIKKGKMKVKKKKGKLYKVNKTNKAVPVQKLIKQAEDLIDSFEYEDAGKLLKKVLRREPNNVEALELLAGVSVETGGFEEAHDLLLKIVELCPGDKYRSYFMLAQISEGEEAIDYYKKGTALLERLLANNTQSEPKDKNLRRDLSDAYCSIAEIYMTDLCDEEDAERQCRAHVDKSLECGPTFPEGHQCLANFLLILQKKEEAKEALTRSLSYWLPQYRASREKQTDNSDEPFLLSYDFRINTSKMLIELQLYDEASEILDGLIDENDSVLETWYLLGWLNYSRGEMYRGNARYYFKRAIKLKETGAPYDPEQISQMEFCLAEMGPGSDDEDDSENQENEAVDFDSDSGAHSGEEMEDD